MLSRLAIKGTELQDQINNDDAALAMFESIRAHGALKMGLISELEEAQDTPAHTKGRVCIQAKKLPVLKW